MLDGETPKRPREGISFKLRHYALAGSRLDCRAGRLEAKRSDAASAEGRLSATHITVEQRADQAKELGVLRSVCVPCQKVANLDPRCPSSRCPIGFVEDVWVARSVVSNQGPNIPIGTSVKLACGLRHVWISWSGRLACVSAKPVERQRPAHCYAQWRRSASRAV
jgi:hypothetical protein